MTDLKRKLLKAYDQAPAIPPMNRAFISSLADILVQQREALEIECGKRCAQQNPCSAREALAATDEALKRIGVEV